MRYFLTGATGFIGGRIARQLISAGHEVVTIARTPAKARDLVDLGVEVFPGDITDRSTMRGPMSGADGVFHVAAWYKIGARDNQMAEQINAGGTRNVLELMDQLAIPRGVYTSTLAVFSDTRGRVVDETYRHYGPWLSEYDRTKWMAHYQVAVPMIAAGLPLTIVQPGLVYGPGDTGLTHTTLVDYLKRRLPLTPRGTAFCWGHIDDTARGHILAMERGASGQSYIIAGPVHTLTEGLTIAAKITGVPAPRLHPSPRTMKALAGVMRLVGRVVPLPEMYNAETIRVAAGVTYLGSNARATRELGFRARPLAEGLRETLDYEMRALGMPLPGEA